MGLVKTEAVSEWQAYKAHRKALQKAQKAEYARKNPRLRRGRPKITLPEVKF